MSARRLLVLLLVIAVGGAALAVGLRTYHYVEQDPRFCQTCHLMETAFRAWQTSAHRDVGCHACHVQSMAESLDQLYKFVTLRPTAVSKHAEVDFTRCGACHLSRDPRWKQVAETAGHKVHFARLGLQCVGCHSKGVHRFVRPSDACGECHTEKIAGKSAMAKFHCTTCHDFLARDRALASPQRADCLECHEHMQVAGERFDPQAPMQFACQQCHRPHVQPLPTMERCLECHHIRDFGLHAVAFHSDCRSCHRPHLWRVEARAQCESCHDDRGEHYPGLPCAGCHGFRASS